MPTPEENFWAQLQSEGQPQAPAPGQFKDDPEGAMRYILSQKATGAQLQRDPQGRLAMEGERGPLAKLFGLKPRLDPLLDQTNYAPTAEAANIAEFLPNGLMRSPDGQPMVDKSAFMTALQAAQSFGEKKRADFFSYIGNDPDSKMPVTYNAANNTFYKGGKTVDASELDRLLNKVKPQLEGGQINEVTNLLNAQSQLEEVKGLFNKDAVGPIQGRLFQASKLMGINLPDLKGMASMTDDKAKLRTVLASGINDYIKAITGAQMSEIEARRIMAAMPNANAADEAFMPMLEQVLKITDTKLKNRLDVLETQGTVGVKELRGLSRKQAPANNTAQSGPDLSSPNGIKAAYKAGKLSREQAKALLQGF